MAADAITAADVDADVVAAADAAVPAAGKTIPYGHAKRSNRCLAVYIPDWGKRKCVQK